MDRNAVVEVDRIPQPSELGVAPALDPTFKVEDTTGRNGDATDPLFGLSAIVVVDDHDIAPLLAGTTRDVCDQSRCVVEVEHGHL